MKPTYLYIKTHNITGLKYFGKTTNNDPYKYNGSGTYWKRHLNKHGNDVSTEIIGYYTDKEECLNVALKFSKDNDIVKSEEWANLKEESLDGGFDFIHQNNLYSPSCSFKNPGVRTQATEKSKKWIEENREEWIKRLKIGMKRKFDDPSYKKQGKPPAKETTKKRKEIYKRIKHQQGEKNSQFGTVWITNGIKPIKIKKCDIIPEGYRLGRK